MVSEGLNSFRDKTHPSLAGHTLIKSKIREDAGCTVIAVRRGEQLRLNPDPDLRLAARSLVLVNQNPIHQKGEPFTGKIPKYSAEPNRR
ncbi:MAG: cation:proton antiporter regulatory subunit [Thermodesulfobacteriota bacterium]